MRWVLAALALIAAGPALAGNSLPEAKGMTTVASYQAPGLCLQGQGLERGIITLQRCAIVPTQLFFGVMERNIRTDEWFMSLKHQSKYGCVVTFAYLQAVSCPDTDWWKMNYFTFGNAGFLTNEENRAVVVDGMGPAVAGAKVGHVRSVDILDYRKTGFYPAVLVPSVRIDKTLAELIRARPGATALVTDNGFSGLNLVAAQGSTLVVNAKGDVATSTGAPIVLGGAGKLIRIAMPQTTVLRPGLEMYIDYNPQGTPKQLDFFRGKKPGRIPLGPLY